MNTQPVSTEQLARLYQARNEANSRMSQALRTKDKDAIARAKAEASRWNATYTVALKAYKRQQKAERREQLRNTMIRFYIDAQEAAA